jgi:hypothetical protein
MHEKIKQMIIEGQEFKKIFQTLKCSDKEFLAALRETSNDDSFKKVIHFENEVIAI